MDPRHIQLVQDSLERVAPFGGPVGDVFAAELLRIAPIAPGQNSAFLNRRRRCALDLMAAAMRSLDKREDISNELRLLGLTSEAGLESIQPADYDYAANAVLRTLKLKLGAEFTSDLWDAWVEALCMLSQTLSKVGGPQPATSAGRAF